MIPSRKLRNGAFALNDRIVAVGLLTQGDLALLGPAFDRAWPIDETPCFTGLLEAIDEADRDLKRARDQTDRAGPD